MIVVNAWWRGAASDACAQLRGPGASGVSGVYSSRTDPGWLYPESFRREPRQSTRQAMKAAGCAVERWSEAAEAAGTIGGFYGGSGVLQRRALPQ